jgi:O-antigen ligase
MAISSQVYANDRSRIIAELVFFAALFYSMTSVNLGINVQYLAFALQMFSVVLSAAVGFKHWLKSPVFLLILVTGAIMVAIQFNIFNLDFRNTYVASFINWVFVAVIALPLARNEGFFKRLAVLIALIFLIQFPYMTSGYDFGVQRWRFEHGATGVDNANDLGYWLGFSFVIFWMWLWNYKSYLSAFLLMVGAITTLILLLNTVSRGALLATLIAVFLTIRAVPKQKRLFYVILLFFVAAIFWLMPFPRALVNNYLTRLFEDSGRVTLLQMGWEALRIAPFWGYGADNLFFQVSMEKATTPHNPFLMIGLSGGYLPLFLFCVLWLVAFSFLVKNKFESGQGIDGLTLFSYAFITSLLSNTMFTSIWVVSILLFVSEMRWNEALSKARINAVHATINLKPVSIDQRRHGNSKSQIINTL